MSRYIALIDRSDDGAFGVWFPDALGATAQADTQDEALQNAAEALSEWMADRISDGRQIPAPRTIEEILRDDADARDAVAGSAVLAAVPLLLETGKLAKANISLDAGLLAEIDEAAKRWGVTRSAFLATAAREKIKAGA